MIYKFGWNHESSSLGMVALFIFRNTVMEMKRCCELKRFYVI